MQLCCTAAPSCHRQLNPLAMVLPPLCTAVVTTHMHEAPALIYSGSYSLWPLVWMVVQETPS